MSDDPIVFGSVHVVASASIDQVNHVVGQWEVNVGPLVDMRIDNAETALKFKATLNKPNPVSVIAPTQNGSPVIPPGAVLVTTGQILIAGQPTLCAATRS